MDFAYSVYLEENFRRVLFSNAISKYGSQEKLAKYLSNRLNKKISRESVKNWIKGKHCFGWKIYIALEVLQELSLITNYPLNEILNKSLEYNPPSADLSLKKFLVKSVKPVIIKKLKCSYLDLFTILPIQTLSCQRSHLKLNLFASVDKKSITLWSEGNWKKSVIHLKRYLCLDDLAYMGAAVFAAEGTTKNSKNSYNSSISFGNTEPALIKIFLSWLDNILLKYNPKFNVDYNGICVNPDIIRRYWNKQLSMDLTNLNIIERKMANTGLINNYGTLKIKIDVTVLKPFILNLINFLKLQVLKDKRMAIVYLRVLIASEGSLNKDKVLKQVTIGVTKPSEQEFIQKLLKKLDLRFTVSKNQLAITGGDSFCKLFWINAFSIPQENNFSKNQRFLSGFMNHKKFKSLQINNLDIYGPSRL